MVGPQAVIKSNLLSISAPCSINAVESHEVRDVNRKSTSIQGRLSSAPSKKSSKCTNTGKLVMLKKPTTSLNSYSTEFLLIE